jgi:hypothetical protein
VSYVTLGTEKMATECRFEKPLEQRSAATKIRHAPGEPGMQRLDSRHRPFSRKPALEAEFITSTSVA